MKLDKTNEVNLEIILEQAKAMVTFEDGLSYGSEYFTTIQSAVLFSETVTNPTVRKHIDGNWVKYHIQPLEQEWKDEVSLKEIPKILLPVTTTNDEVIILNLLERIILMFPEATKEVEEIIYNTDISDVTKTIRQTSDCNGSVLFYEILNGTLGYKIIKTMKTKW